MSPIESLFRKQVKKDKNIRNAYLYVHSAKTGLTLTIADAHDSQRQRTNPDPNQPVYMASVGKLFTSVIVAQLHDRGKLRFDDPISQHLDSDLINGLHLYKGHDYSEDIQIRHLLNQTSGLPDNFYPLFDKLLADKAMQITPRESVIWAKENLKPKARPGRKCGYTDTNYHLLGLTVEAVCKKPFHEVLKELIFDPLDMNQSYMLHYSKAEFPSEHEEAGFYFKDTRLNDIPGFAGLDYSGGGVVAPMLDLGKFMQALTSGGLVSDGTFQTMMNDKALLYPGWDYGYAIWQVRPIPILLPARYRSWGVLGATGAFMFYHPETQATIIGSFNHESWQRKCVRFMFKIIDRLV